MSGRIPLPDPCRVGQHEPAILCRGGRQKVANRCGRCGREIERQTEKGGPSDPWMTQEQHEAEMRELAADEAITESTGGERCPPRE